MERTGINRIIYMYFDTSSRLIVWTAAGVSDRSRSYVKVSLIVNWKVITKSTFGLHNKINISALNTDLGVFKPLQKLSLQSIAVC